MRDSFVFYRSFQRSIQHLEASEQLEVYHAIIAYALDQVEPELTRYSQAVWEAIKPQIAANQRKYEAGLRGGKPKANQDLTIPEPSPNLMYNVNENDNVNEKVNDKENEKENENEQRFDQFWTTFPRKTDKARAKRSFLRLTKTEQELAVSNIQRLYSETPAQFIPHPSTYLNGKRWEDQAIQRTPTFTYANLTSDESDSLSIKR
ncbi:MAG: DUF6291 domain-containing protein [Bacteroidia bacterium]